MNRIAELKTELLCYGIRTSEEMVSLKAYPTKGKSRAGVAGSGRNFIVNPGGKDEFVANIGVLHPFLDRSPFEFRRIDGRGWILKNGEKILRATVFEPKWHATKAGEIVRLHGKSSLALALTNNCIFKSNRMGCKFCIIDIGKEKITHKPEDIANAIKEIENNAEIRKFIDFDGSEGLVEPTDININSGTLEEPDLVKFYAETARAIRAVSDLPIGIEITPVGKEGLITLKNAEIDSIYINIEVFSDTARRKIIPGKDRSFSRDRYLKVMEEAIEIFGENQVASWILIGLEPTEETVKGCEAIAETGAIPLPRAFRPLFSSELENHLPPNAEEAKRVYSEWLRIIKEQKLDPLKTTAGCAKCGSCFPIRELLI
ncbi:MAG: hypothetical protein NZ879_06520 [Archaeoglobaceae archaeon]|nr:hypothetical protein [Archaeoglobaceae archaeon]MDW8118619.1 hypothetical protein [Archaeoglobaceae archaeon]